MLPLSREHRHLVLGGLRRREGVGPVQVQQLHGGRRRDADVVGGAGEVQVELGAVALCTDVGVHAADARSGEVAVAVVVNALEGQEAAPRSAVATDGQAALVATERAAHDVELGTLEVEAVTHHDGQSTTERVETEHRVGADDGHAADGVVGQEVVVDDIAEALVDAHAVLIDGEALRHAVDRR